MDLKEMSPAELRAEVRRLRSHLEGKAGGGPEEAKSGADPGFLAGEICDRLFQHGPLMAFAWRRVDGDFLLEELNRAVVRFFGEQVRDFVGRAASELYPDMPRIPGDLAACLERGSLSRVMTYPRRIDGQKRLLRFHYLTLGPDLVLMQVEELTGEHEALRALRESEELHRQVLTAISDAVYLTDDAGRFVFVCPNVDIIFGYTAEEIRSFENISKVLGPDTFDAEALALAGELSNLEYRALDKKGREHELLVTVKQVDIRGGSRLYACRDVTETRAAEKESRRASRRLETVFRSAAVGIAVFDADGGFLESNEQWRQLFGRTREQLQNLSCRDIVLAEDLEDWERSFSDLLAEREESRRVEKRLRRGDGSLFWGDVTLTLLPEQDDSAPGLLAVVMDATWRRQAEEALRKSKSHLQKAQELARLGSWHADRLTGRVEWSAQASRLFGLPAEPMITDYDFFYNHVLPEDLPACMEARDNLLRDKGSYDMEFRIRTVDGEVRHIHSLAEVVRDESGRVTAIEGVLQDITERKHMEQLREDVERIMRHDLKTPMISAGVYLPRLFRSTQLGPDQERLVEMLEQAGKSALAMINATLDIYKMERGMYEPSLEPVDLLALVRRVVAEMEVWTRDKSLRVEVEIRNGAAGEGGSLVEKTDENLLYFMLSNLVRNAVEASPPSGVVRVILARDGERWSMAVHNLGEIPEPIRHRFFEKYVTHGKRSGTGLGTYSARLIAQTLGGSIGFASDPESGTTVTVTVPHRS